MFFLSLLSLHMRGFVTGISLVFTLLSPALLRSQIPPAHPSSRPSSLSPSLEGATKLFDGRSLRGWTSHGGRYDGKARWSVEDGCIVGQVGPRGEGGLLYTQKPYSDFVFSCEVKIDYPFDSGIFIGMEPRGQLRQQDRKQDQHQGRYQDRNHGRQGWQVTLDHRPRGEIGGIYSDGWLQHNPKGWNSFKKNQWNRVIIRSRGYPPRIEAWINGKKITDYQHTTRKGFAPLGKIGIQVHGAQKSWWKNKVRFKNIQVLELPPDSPKLFSRDRGGRLSPTPQAKAEGWHSMLRTLEQWNHEGQGPSPFSLKKGVLAVLAEGAGSNLWTKESYKDFELRLDFKLSPSANSGLFLHGHPQKSGAYAYAYEIQILDDWNWEKDHKAKLKPWQHCGSLYGLAPPIVSALLPPGSWNSYHLSLIGSKLQVKLNGRTVHDLDLRSLPGRPFTKRPRAGAVGLQVHGGGRTHKGPYLWIRNFYLRRIE